MAWKAYGNKRGKGSGLGPISSADHPGVVKIYDYNNVQKVAHISVQDALQAGLLVGGHALVWFDEETNWLAFKPAGDELWVAVTPYGENLVRITIPKQVWEPDRIEIPKGNYMVRRTVEGDALMLNLSKRRA